MEKVKIILAVLWIATMFAFDRGDLQRLYAGDYIPGDDIAEGIMSMETLWLISAITMTIPVIMAIVSVTLENPVNRWSNIIVAILFIFYNINGVRMYASAYDRLLIVISMVYNVLIVWFAWKWV
jgi:hypothetical protein